MRFPSSEIHTLINTHTNTNKPTQTHTNTKTHTYSHTYTIFSQFHTHRSERSAKTGATGQQIIEAKSINQSLSALGNVISALSSNSEHIPYRNNLLTRLMQDSLGGNAKTLMFVNISPADYNHDETVISLTYAARVKLITNDAQKNADNKEIARLKAIIDKLKRGEAVADDEKEKDDGGDNGPVSSQEVDENGDPIE